MRTNTLMFSFVAMWILTAGIARAIDVGDPVYKKDCDTWINNRLEVLYEKYDRDVNVRVGDTTVSGPGGKITEPGSEDMSTNTDSKVFMVRLNLMAVNTATVYLDAGVLDYSDAKSNPYTFGGGVRFVIYEQAKMRLNVVGMAHYVPSFDTEEEEWFSEQSGHWVSTGTISFYEAAAGAILSGIPDQNVKARFVPYGGVLFSLLRGTVDIEQNFTDYAVTAKTSGDIEEKNPVTVVAGMSLLVGKSFSVRVEGRFVSESSLSGALGYAF